MLEWITSQEKNRNDGLLRPTTTTKVTFATYIRDAWLPLYRTQVRSTYNIEKTISKWVLNPRGKRQYLYDPGDTGFLHFLYRLRIRSTYRGVDLFLVEAGEDAHRSFRQSLLCVVVRSLTYVEIALMRKCRRSVIAGMAKDFVSKNSLATQVQKRFDAYQSLY